MGMLALVVDGRVNDYCDAEDNNIPAHKRYLWRPVVEEYPEGFDPLREELAGKIADVEDDRVVWRWTSRPIPALMVPREVSSRQLREALWRRGLLEETEELIKLMDRGTQIRWEYDVTFDRSHPQWEALGAMLDPPQTPADIDDLFRLAASIV